MKSTPAISSSQYVPIRDNISHGEHMPENDIFKKLFAVLESRKTAAPESSYVAGLFAKGVPKINAKITEEAAEVCGAANEPDNKHLTYEICDLFFHTLVLASYKGIPLSDIETELARRFGTSGIAEKASRPAEKDASKKGKQGEK